MAGRTRPCVRCGVMIPPERDEAMRETRLCVQCSQQVGGDFHVTVVPENLAKSNSIKKNYAGWAVKKTRRIVRRPEE